ncbi:Solute carrier family 35 member C2 like protein [Argiope bruennichi]|uniref:Solute carrier family 35 member C2 like protein n=1 Tax=Argiope bruennichi TaxID=94029 RepID=A0A8T0DZK3_ARGBR|nr:Solute carrier family 35 member C2 like protein [Argiope bruennichi]
MKRRREVSQSNSHSSCRQTSFLSFIHRFNACCYTCPEKYDPKMKKMDSLCTVRLIFTFLKTIGLVCLYYCFSIGITFYQKWFIKDFHFPLTVVICHLVVKFVLSGILRCVYHVVTGRQRVVLDWPTYFKQLAPTGIASALDIGLSNWSFEFITISLYTMTKSTCIIFILGFSLLFGLEKKRYSLIIVVGLIAAGLFMFTYQSTQFNLDGFLLVLSASFLAGLRWTLAQMVVQRKEMGLGNPVDMIYHVQPWMVVGLLPLAIVFEGIPIATTEKVFRYKEVSVECLKKCVVPLYLASLNTTGGDHMTTVNFIGLIVCLIGITLHVILKALDSNEYEKEKEHQGWQQLLNRNGMEADDDEEDVIFETNPVARL